MEGFPDSDPEETSAEGGGGGGGFLLALRGRRRGWRGRLGLFCGSDAGGGGGGGGFESSSFLVVSWGTFLAEGAGLFGSWRRGTRPEEGALVGSRRGLFVAEGLKDCFLASGTGEGFALPTPVDDELEPEALETLLVPVTADCRLLFLSCRY